MMRAPANAVKGPLGTAWCVSEGELIEPCFKLAIHRNWALGHVVTQFQISRIEEHSPGTTLPLDVHHAAKIELVQNVAESCRPGDVLSSGKGDVGGDITAPQIRGDAPVPAIPCDFSDDLLRDSETAN